MKRCNIVSKNLVEYIYDEIDESRKKFINEHLRHCERCKEEVIKMKKTLSSFESKEIISPDYEFWEECWTEIRKNIMPHSEIDEKIKSVFIEKLKSLFKVPSGSGFKLIGVTAVLLIGFFVGRYVSFENKYEKLWNSLERLDKPVIAESLNNPDDEKLFRIASINFLKKTEVILLEFSGLTLDDKNREHELSFIKNLSGELIKETRTFKKVSEKFDNPRLKELFNLLEMILIEINNMDVKDIKGIKKSMMD
ncbi:hypothetical protein DRQ09_06280 [candidate division KSB1 bacterium]|nr:MAG: hypothetical protein DRQ09_06280 [candidate division KSB1 bacterium]